MNKKYSRSFLKWAGGKYSVLDNILNTLPQGKRLVEPFVGAATVFLNTDFEENLLCDCNSDLISLYQTLQKHGQKFIDDAKSFYTPQNHNKNRYYQLRDQFNQSSDPYERACLFLYFNRHGYNGLCRYNSKGGFNVPFGKYATVPFPEKAMVNFYKKSQNAQFICADFATIMKKTKKNDVVYCDPPYAPLSDLASFTAYQTKAFDLDEQVRLAKTIKSLQQKDRKVLISNHDTEFTRKLYNGAKIKSFKVRRFISYNGVRNHAQELLALFD